MVLRKVAFAVPVTQLAVPYRLHSGADTALKYWAEDAKRPTLMLVVEGQRTGKAAL